MSITAAEVEANGWVLRLTVTAALGTFASYTLDPDGSPRVQLAASHPGFAPSGGVAAPTTITRNLVATRPLRLPVNFASPSVKVIDETDLGGGQIRVRLALSETVYATDTGLTLTALAGWRTGLPGQSGIAVTNNSTIAAPIPIMRWVLRSYQTATGPFRVALVVFSHHPVGFQPVAGVRFVFTDGTTVKTQWVTALDTDPSLDDGLRCYTTVLDPTTATALTAGLLRVDAEVYPWLGAMRSTDPAGTRSMTNLRTDGYLAQAAAPWVIGYDPTGARYGQMWAYVDPVNGSTTAAAGMVATTLAGAKAVPPASRPRSIDVAIQAGYLVNRTLAAANGQASQTRSLDGMTIVLAPGTHAYGTVAVTTGATTAEIPARIIGDPDDPNPRVNCIFNTTAAPPSLRINRSHWENLSVGLGTNIVVSTTYWTNDRVTFAGRAGLETNTAAPFAATPPAGQLNASFTRCRAWRFGTALISGNPRALLIRACEHSRQMGAPVYLKNRFIPATEDTFTPGATMSPYSQGGPGTITAAAQWEDQVAAWNDWRGCRARAVNGLALPTAAQAGTPNQSLRRWVVVGNVAEKFNGDVQPFFSVGEDVSITASYNIIEGNTFVGERVNGFYSDPVPPNVVVRGDTGISANAVQFTAHGYANDDRVKYSLTNGATALAALTPNTVYWVVNAAANSFQLAATQGGAPIAIVPNSSTATGQNFGNLTRADAQRNEMFCNRVAGNIFDWFPTKHDDFLDPAVDAMRANTPDAFKSGFRPQMVDSWQALYGVGYESNVEIWRTGSTHNLEWPGLRSQFGSLLAATQTINFTDDRSAFGANTGVGDYTLAGGGIALNRVQRGQADVDFAGNARAAGSAAGAYSGPLGAIALAPDNGSFALAGAVASASAAAGMNPDPGSFALAGAVVSASAAAAVAPAAGSFSFSGSQAALTVTPGITLAVDGASFALAGAAAGVSAGAAVTPAAGHFALAGGTPAVLAAAVLAASAASFALRDDGVTVTAEQIIDTSLAPVTLAEAKAWLRLTDDEDEDEPLISALIRAAAARIEQITGLVMRERDITLSQPVFGARLVLTRRPVNAVLAVEYDDKTTGQVTALDVATLRLREWAGQPVLQPAFGTEFPATDKVDGAVRVTVNAGYPSNSEVPEDIRTAALLMIGHWYQNREAVGTGNITSELPLGAAALLSPYRRGHLG